LLQKIKDLFKRDDQRLGSGHFIRVGTSGTDKQGGYYEEEYLVKIRSDDGSDIYDQMRRSDAQVRMLLSVLKNPLLSANWQVEASDITPEAMQQKELIEHILFEDISWCGKRKTWREFLVECLSMFDFGFSMFEVIHKVVMDDPKFGNYIGLKDLGFRSQKTIEQWNTDKAGRLISVEQDAYGDLEHIGPIPGSDLMTFTINKEGDNYEGISLLRPVYGNWYRKNLYYKMLAIGIERSANSVPVIKYPDEIGTADTKINEAAAVAKAYTSHQLQYIALPKSFEFESWKLDFNPEQVIKAIEHEDTSMAKAFMANFMEMGLSGTGSYALGTDMSDLFLGSITHYADLITEKFNTSLIPQLIDAKYGKQEKYPKLKVSGINDKMGKEFAEIISMLTLNGLVVNDARLKEFLHQQYGLPEIMEDEEAKEELKTEEAASPTLAPSSDMKDPETQDYLFQVGQDKKETAKLIGENSKQLKFLMAEQDMQKTPGNLSLSRPSILAKDIPGKEAYRAALTEFLKGLNKDAFKQVFDELGIEPKKKTPPSVTKQREKGEVELLAAAQEADLQKNMKFEYNTKVDSATSVDQMTNDLKKSASNYLTGAALVAGATNVVSSTVNNARNDTYQAALEEIESFEFVNPDPKAAICQELAGRVFTKEEYLTTANLPPLHHNCKSFIRAQTKAAKGNKPVTEIGLNFTGTETQVEQIVNSKKF